MDTMIVFHFTASGDIHYAGHGASLSSIEDKHRKLLEDALRETAVIFREMYSDVWKSLSEKKVQVRIVESLEGSARLLPHEILLNAAVLDAEKRRTIQRRRMLTGVLFRMLFHWTYPELHVTEVSMHTMRFLQSRRELLSATIDVLKSHPEFGETDWLSTLCHLDELILLDNIWLSLAGDTAVQYIIRSARGPKSKIRTRIKSIISEFAEMNGKDSDALTPADIKLLSSFQRLFIEDDSVVIIYSLPDNLLKVIRLCDHPKLDAMSTTYACRSVYFHDVRTDVFHDHGQWIRGWVEQIKTEARDPSLKKLEQTLLSDDVQKVRTAISQLRQKIRRNENVSAAYRILYAALYYWNNSNKGLCRSICLEVSALLEDLLTERPFTFPPSRVNRSVFRSKKASVTIHIQKPRNVRKDIFKARILWSVNGRRKKPIPMTQSGSIRQDAMQAFNAVFPVRNGWIHYAVQFSIDDGRHWQWEDVDEHSHGLIKYVADERGQRVLSFYADTLNLRLDEHYQPVLDENGAFVYGTFDDIAEQLEAIRDEGYTRIYPLGALELGWAGEAGPDPSVFSVLDGRTVRRDLGGLDGLLRLREKADALDMKVLLCVLSHFSRANSSFPYELPVYILNQQGKLTPRAGWDGEWSEWLDSFMVNMRDFENVDYLAQIGVELAELGFGLRVDVGHGYDTVFPVEPSLNGKERLLGQVTVKGFEPVDLRKTEEPNLALLYMCYKIQKAVPNALLVYSEQWHGNETRMIKSGTIPYNSLIKNLEHIRSGQDVNSPMGLNDNLSYLNRIYDDFGCQTLSLFNSHDEESPASNYQNMIWPTAAFLALSSTGPLMYHISRLPGPEAGSMQQRFDEAYTECWKHWVNNRFRHPWHEENRARWQIISHYPILFGFGKYLRRLYHFIEEHPAFVRGRIIPLKTENTRIAAFMRTYKNRAYICLFNFPDPHTEGQAAVTRNFNFSLESDSAGTQTELIDSECAYEITERYNNTEGRTRRGSKEYWSGHEIKHLGFGGVLEGVSSHVFEITQMDEFPGQALLIDSFKRYPSYGKQDRVQYCYVAQSLTETVSTGSSSNFRRFSELFVTLANWIDKKHQLGLNSLSSLLKEISEENDTRRARVLQFLMRIAVNEKQRFNRTVCRTAADILHGMNLGTIALVSPESQYSGHAGGVGIYTTDIADVLSELGFHVVVVTPLYEAHREKIIRNYSPRYDGHNFKIQFPEFDEQTQSISRNTSVDVINILRSNLLRHKHGKHSRVEVLYLENGKYLDVPYGGRTGEDKLRRARILSQGALEALRAYNYYPTIIQTNEWPTWLVSAYLDRWPAFSTDPHFQNTHVASMMHNPHPSYSITMDEANPFRRYYYCLILGMDAVVHSDVCINPDSLGGNQIDMTYMMLKTSSHIGTVSRAMKKRILSEPAVFKYGYLYQKMENEGRFFGRRNGFNMAARQRFWFRSKKSMLETSNPASRRRLFSKYTHAKILAKAGLQNDENIRLRPDEEQTNHVIFSMLHRICKQKGFELLLDWKVYEDHGNRWVTYEPWKMMGPTVLEYFLSTDERIQFVVCGRVEDSFDGRRFDMHFQRIAHLPQFQGRFAYFPQGALPPSLYRNVYVGSQFFVMPSGGEVGEPCGISQQEAHAGGTPVVAHHQDGLIRTVCDAEFGDTENPPNGVKFSGFNGESLLNALLDAVEIYYHNRRLHYVDPKGRPRKRRYSDLSFNAFNTDHRWLRLLRDYIQTYCLMANVQLPEHVDAIRFITAAADLSDQELPNLILKNGMKVPDAVDHLIEAMECPIASVRKATQEVMLRLYGELDTQSLAIVQKRLSKTLSLSPDNKNLVRLFEKIGQISPKAAQKK